MSEIEARREARRRKILENSENRLKKITGLETRHVNHAIDGYRGVPVPVQDDEAEVTSTVHTNVSPPTGAQVDFIKSHRMLAITFIALFQYVLFWGNLPFVNKMFVPLLCFEAVDLLYNSNRGEGVDYLLMFLGNNRNISRQKLSILLKFIVAVKTVIGDVMVYFFVVVCLLFVQSLVVTTDVAFIL